MTIRVDGSRSEVPDPDGGAGIEAEDLEEGEGDRGRGGDDRSTDDRQFARIHIAATNRETASDDRGNPEHKPEEHDHGKAVTDTGLELGGGKRRPLRLRCITQQADRDQDEGEYSGSEFDLGEEATAREVQFRFRQFHKFGLI